MDFILSNVGLSFSIGGNGLQLPEGRGFYHKTCPDSYRDVFGTPNPAFWVGAGVLVNHCRCSLAVIIS